MEKTYKSLVLLVSTLILIFGGWIGTRIYKNQQKINELKQNYASINAINYGLFNMQEWKIKAFDVFSHHIENFQISPKAFDEAESELRKYLFGIYDDYIESGSLFNKVFEDAEKKGKVNKVLLKMFKDNIGSQIQALNIKEHIPGMAKQLGKELKKQEPRFKEIMQQELRNLLQYTDKYTFTDPRFKTFESYECSDVVCTNKKINASLISLNDQQRRDILWFSTALLLVLLINSVFFKSMGSKTWVGMISLVSIILLIMGITLPMIVIDARINSFVFNLFEKDLSFSEQVVFFQNKSILDVAYNLLESKGWDLKIVGILVICFSVIFPMIKLILGGFYLQSARLQQNKMVQNMIFYLGKWSMADVFVVALFMTYIGFYGLFNAQLDQLEQNKGGFAIETVNYTHLAPGALFFTSYCILSIILGIVINRISMKNLKS